MRELLKAEFLKLKKSKSFYGWGVFLTFTIFVIALYVFIDKSYTDTFDFVCILLTFPIFPLICLHFSSQKALENIDINYIKNVPPNGFAKKQIYFAKYIASFLTILFYLIVSIIFAFLMGLIFFAIDSPFGLSRMLYNLALQILGTITIHSLSFGFTTLFKSTGASIAFNTIGFVIISLILGIILGNLTKVWTIMYCSPLGAFFGSMLTGIDIKFLCIQLGLSVVYSLIGIGVGLIRCRDKKD